MMVELQSFSDASHDSSSAASQLASQLAVIAYTLGVSSVKINATGSGSAE